MAAGSSQPTARRQRGGIFGGWKPSPGFLVSVASTRFSVPGSRLDATVAGGFVSVASRGVRKAEGKSKGFLVESRGAHPLCDGNSAEAHKKEGVACAPACRVCRVGAGLRSEERRCGVCCAGAEEREVEEVREVKEEAIRSAVNALGGTGEANMGNDSRNENYCQGTVP